MRTFLKKLAVMTGAVLAFGVLYGWFPPPAIDKAVIAAPVPTLYQIGCPTPADGGDIGVPSWLCTQLQKVNTNINTVAASANNVDKTQAPTLATKDGYISTGHVQNLGGGFITGSTLQGIAAAVGQYGAVTMDGGVVSIGHQSNEMRAQTNLGGSQIMRLMNTAGSKDAGHVMNMIAQGTVVQQVPSTGYYFQTVQVGALDSYGTATVFANESPHETLHPQSMYFIVNGAFSAGEIVTVRLVGYDENDAGITMIPGNVTTFDAGVTSTEYDDWNLWYAIAAAKAVKANTFQRVNFQRIVIDAKSDAGAPVTSVDVMVRAIQN